MNFWVLLIFAHAQNSRVEPVTKILQTLQNVFANVQEEHQTDEQTYKRFYEWCNAVFKDRKADDERAVAAKAELESQLQVQAAQNKQLRDEALQLDEELKGTKETIDQASGMRQQEHQDYLREETEFSQILQVLNRAVDVLRASTSKQTLVQVTRSLQQIASQSTVVSDSQRDQLQQFASKAQLSSDSDDVITQTSSVLQVMHELISQFQQSAAAAVDQEKSALEQYDNLISLKKQSYSQIVTAKDSKDAMLAESLQRAAQVQRSSQDAAATVDSMGTYLHSVQAVCTDKSSQWATRSQSRADILEGLQRALAALAGDSQAITALQPPQQTQQFPLSFLQMQQGMLSVQQAVNEAPKANTYSAVKGMVESMMGQLNTAGDDEEKHKQWCDQEIGKSTSTQEEKETKLQRLATKLDNEKEIVTNLDQEISSEGTMTSALQTSLEKLAKLRMDERDFTNKAQQNHQMALQILQQATTILQRVNALAAQAQAPGTFGFLQATGATSAFTAVSSTAVESLSMLQNGYASLATSCQKAETQAQLDIEAFGRASQALQEALARAHNYKTSVRLQGMSSLDQDQEDEAALKTQVTSVVEYVNRLRTSCAGILQHYDERRQRREQNLKVLSEAKNVINVDNAEEVHNQLKSMAQNTDDLAQSLVSTSRKMDKVLVVNTPAPSMSMLGNSLAGYAQSFAQVQFTNAPLQQAPSPAMAAPQQFSAPPLAQVQFSAPPPQMVLQQFSAPPAPQQEMQAPQQTQDTRAAVLQDLESLNALSPQALSPQ